MAPQAKILTTNGALDGNSDWNLVKIFTKIGHCGENERFRNHSLYFYPNGGKISGPPHIHTQHIPSSVSNKNTFPPTRYCISIQVKFVEKWQFEKALASNIFWQKFHKLTESTCVQRYDKFSLIIRLINFNFNDLIFKDSRAVKTENVQFQSSWTFCNYIIILI